MDIISAGSLAYTPYGYSFHAGTLLLGFNGCWIDSKMYVYPLGNGHRFYNPSLSRFMSSDSLSPFGAGGVNAYCYCLGDPINRHDPTGRVSQLWERAMAAFRRSRIQRLPNEVLEHIATQMPGQDLAAFARTSKRMQAVALPVLKESQQRFWSRLLKEPDTQSKMVFALRVSRGVEKDIHPGAANSLEMTREMMDDLILESNRKHYAPQITAITIRQTTELANLEDQRRHELVQLAIAQGIN